jgi:hypothetical protein
MKNAVFLDVTPCESCKNLRFEGTYRVHLQGVVFLRRVLLLLVTRNIVPRSQTLATLMMDVIRSSEKSVLTTATRRNIQVDDFLQFSFTFLSNSAFFAEYFSIGLRLQYF